MANSTNTSTVFTAITTAVIIFLTSCQKELKLSPVAAGKVSSLSEFYDKNAVPLQTFSVDAANGGSFTGAAGSIVTIPSSAFVDGNGNAVTGNVTVELREIYKKSDMLLSNMPTTSYGWPLQSGGEFFIRATNTGGALLLQKNKRIQVKQPAAVTGGNDAAMKAFIGIANADSIANNNWNPVLDSASNPQAAVLIDADNYVFSLYQFSTPAANGTWCNSDNSDYFSKYTTTSLLISSTDTGFGRCDVYLVFKDVNCMVHVYATGVNSNNLYQYTYNYAPVGLQCTVVAITVKGDTLYSSFTPITISANQTVNFSLSATTTEAFKTALGNL